MSEQRFSEAIARHVTESKQAAADKRRQQFEPDPELERLGARMDEMARTSPKEFADANLGDIRSRVSNYRIRKAEHEENDQ